MVVDDGSSRPWTLPTRRDAVSGVLAAAMTIVALAAAILPPVLRSPPLPRYTLSDVGDNDGALSTLDNNSLYHLSLIGVRARRCGSRTTALSRREFGWNSVQERLT